MNRLRIARIDRHRLRAVGLVELVARGIDIAAVSVCDLKLRPRHSLLRRGAAVFLDDQISERLIEELQMHRLATLDLDVLRRLVQQEPSRGPDLACDDRHARLQAIHKDLTCGVSRIDTIVVADKRTVTAGQ